MYIYIYRVRQTDRQKSKLKDGLRSWRGGGGTVGERTTQDNTANKIKKKNKKKKTIKNVT